MKLIVTAAFLLMSLVPVFSQQSKDSSPSANDAVVSAVRQMGEHYGRNLTGAADEMPADKYSYRPTPEQITFGHLMTHVAESNNRLCSAIGGETHDVKLSESDSKDTLAKAVKDSFAYCSQVLEKANDSNLGQAVTLGNGQTSTRGALLVRLTAGWADHYSAAAMYLRLNNLLPPSAAKK